MNWLPKPVDFKEQFLRARATTEGDRFAALAELAAHRLSYLETIQLDRALQQVCAARAGDLTSVKVALLSNSTVDHLAPAIRVAGIRRRLRLEVYVGGYDQYRQELLDESSPLARFAPDVVLLSLTAHSFIAGVPLDATRDAADAAIAQHVADLRVLWQRARTRFNATVIQQTWLDVNDPLFGSLDRQVPGSPSRLVANLNEQVARAAAEGQVLLLDVAREASRTGLDAWFDVARWLQGKLEIAPQAAPMYGDLVARLVAAQRGQSKKCLILDLDNTVWGGVIGDDGIEGIVLGEGSAVGEAHLALQAFAKRLRDRGIILAVCSKNDPAIAASAFADHPEMLLRPSDIAVFVANWDDKAANIRMIAERLNIGLDSLVFVDDNPAERSRVREALPMVSVPELPRDVAGYVRCIADAGYFESTGFTDEDRDRANQYETNAQRESLRDTSQNMEDFLEKLDMIVQYGAVQPVDLPRVIQLINKTNQFNTTGRRYSSEEVSTLSESPNHMVLYFRLIDRFGDNGIVSAMILGPVPLEPLTLRIDSWVMSCRVFGRELEQEIMNIVAEAARERGVQELQARYVATKKNAVIAGMFESLGFARIGTDVDRDGAIEWKLPLGSYDPKRTFIAREANSSV